jgi:hypothetical protein
MENLKTKRGIPVDITLTGQFVGKDPYFSEIYGLFISSTGKKISMPGFYRGEGKWSVRFSSEEESDWSYYIYSNTIFLDGETSGKIQVRDEDPGTAKLLRSQGIHFFDSSGKPIFIFGIECNFLFSLLASPDGFVKMQKFVKNIKEVGFNQIQVNAYAYDYSYCKGKTCENDYGPSSIELWEKHPEGRRFNSAFFDNYDKMIDYLNRNGIYAHIYLRVYNKYVDLPENYSEEDYAYYRLFVARYQAYPNIIWNISKEGYFEPDKKYFYTMLGQIRVWDAYKHLCTIHDDLTYSFHKKYKDTIDFLTIQQHYDWPHAHLYFIEKSGKPVISGETGRESPETEQFYGGLYRYNAERICEMAYEIIMTGSYYQYYNTYLAWDVIEYDSKPKGYEYLGRLFKFFSQFDLSSFKAARHLCAWCGLALDDENSTLLVLVDPKKHVPDYINKEGRTLIDLTFDREVISCEAFGILTGKKENYDLSDKKHSFDFNIDNGYCGRRGKDLAILESFSDEATVFVIKYRLINVD